MSDLGLGIVITAITLFVAVIVVWLFLSSLRMSERQASGSGSSPDGELTRRLGTVRFMSGSQFEVFVADVLRGMGYRATVLGGSGDQGVDIIATVGNERIAIQCKNYAKPVSNKPVQEVYAGSRHHGCTAAWVVAPEGFTKGAVELARSVGVSLHDARYLQACIQQIDRAEREKAQRVEANSEPMKHSVRVGSKASSSVGETVTFAANLLGTVEISNFPGLYYTYYRLPDGTFRVLVENERTSILMPSNMVEATSSGQRNNFSYGRMTLEELKAHESDFWPGYEWLMNNPPENVRDGPRDID